MFRDFDQRRRKRIVIHVGYHKTGTTSIQVCLTRAREKIRAAGILYPQHGIAPQFPYGHHYLPWSLMRVPPIVPLPFGAEGRRKLWSDLVAEIEAAECPLVILSSEEFDRLCRREIAQLAHALSDYDIVPIVFLRNYADLIESMFRTHVVALGYAGSIERFAAEVAPRLDSADMVRDWSAVARGGAVTVISYDDEGVRRDSVAAFLAAIDVRPDALGEFGLVRENKSVPAFVCEVARYFRQQPIDPSEVQRWISWVCGIEFALGSNTRYVCMPAELRETLNDRFLIEAAKIRSEFGSIGTLPSSAPGFDGVVISSPTQALFEFARSLQAV